MIFLKLHPLKQLMSSSFYLSFKIEYECSQMYEHQLINYYIHKLHNKQVTMFFNKRIMDSYGVDHLPKLNHHTMQSPKGESRTCKKGINIKHTSLNCRLDLQLKVPKRLSLNPKIHSLKCRIKKL